MMYGPGMDNGRVPGGHEHAMTTSCWTSRHFLVLLLVLLLRRASTHGEDVGAAAAESPWDNEAWDASVLPGLRTFGGEEEEGGSAHSHIEGDAGHSHMGSNSSTLKGGSVPHILIVYFSQTHHTERLANVILNGALDLIPSCHIEVVPVDKANHSAIMEWADVLVLGTPVIHGKPAKEITDYLEGISEKWRPMMSRVRGAVFTTSGGIAGGQEVVIDALRKGLEAKGIEPLVLPDCRYMAGLTAVTGFPPFCRRGPPGTDDGGECEVSNDAEVGEIHPKFESYGYEYGRQLVRIMADPNASGPY